MAAFVLLSNHLHALLRAARGDAISHFMQYIKAGLARLTHEYNGTHGPVWDGPLRSSNLLDDEAEMWWLRYILEHGVKENLVSSPMLWPGPQTASHLYNGESLDAAWLDRVAWNDAGRGPMDAHLRPVPFKLTPLTGYAGRPTEWRQTCRRLIDEIVDDHVQETFLGPADSESVRAGARPTR